MYKSATLYSNDPERPTIVFSLIANVIKGAALRAGKHIGPVFVSPDTRAALFAYPGKKATTELLITADDKPVNILRVEGAEKHFGTRLETIEPGRSYRIRVDTIPTDISDLYQGRLQVFTDNPTLPAFHIELALRVYAKP